MALPITYNIRNLIERRTTTLMTSLGIALTVAVLLAVLALVAGLRTAFRASGNPLNILVMRKGTTAELNSGISRQVFNDVKFKPGIARNAKGEPAVSLEMVTVINLASVDAPDGINVTLRGLLPAGFEMRNEVRLAAGRMFDAGKREVVVGKSIVTRYPAAQLGKKLRFGKGEWDVVGVMDGGKSSVNSEIFGDLNQVSSDYNRSDGLSSILVRAVDEVAAAALINDMEGDIRLNVSAIAQVEYFEAQMISAAPVQFLGIFVSLIMAVGSSFAAMNTMYAAVARRSREIGTLRVLGFSRRGILVSFFLEGLFLSFLGGVLGCILVLPLNNLSTGIGSFVTFSEITFDYTVTPEIMALGIGFALFMGALGGLFPAASAARKEILTALREI